MPFRLPQLKSGTVCHAVVSSSSLQTFGRQLKTRLFQLSYPHLIFDRLTGTVTVVLVVMFVIYATLKIYVYFLPRCMKLQRGRATRKLSVCPSIRLSVRLSVKRVICGRTKETCANIFYITWKISHPGFVTRRMVGWSDLSTWNFESSWPRWSENDDFQSIFARSASAVTSSEKKFS